MKRTSSLSVAGGLALGILALGTVPVCSQQVPVAFIPDATGNAVESIRLNDNDERRFPGFSSPNGLTSTPDGKFVFVKNGVGATITPFRVSDRTVMKVIPLSGFTPFDMEVSADSKLLFIAATFRLIVFDVAGWAADTRCGSLPPGGDPINCPVDTFIRRNVSLSTGLGVVFNITNSAVGIAPDMGTLYIHSNNVAPANTVIAFKDVAKFGDPAVSLTELWRKTLTSTIQNPNILLFRRDGTKAFLHDGFNPFVINVPSDPKMPDDTLLPLTPAVLPPDTGAISDLQIAPNGNFVYGSSSNNAEIFELNGLDLSLVRTIPMHDPALGELRQSFNARGLSFRADSSRVFVSLNSKSGGTSFLRGRGLTTGDLTPSIPLLPGTYGRVEVAEALAAPDTTPPVFTTPLVAGANVGNYLDPTNTVFSFADANQLVSRISVQDAESGLSKPTLYAALSTDGGATFAQQTAAFSGPDGSTALEEVNSPSPWAPLNVVQSWAPDPTPALRRNVIRFSISNKANTASPLLDIPVAVNLNPFRTPSLSSPADDAAISAAQATLTWSPHPDIPIQAIQSSKVEISVDSNFSSILQTLDVTAPALTATTSLPPEKYYWRVRMLDKFGPTSYSPPSPARSFTLDTVPPQLSQGMVAVGGSGLFQDPATASYPVLEVDARSCAHDALSGLAPATARADYSTDGGITFTQRAPAAVTVSETSACPGAETIVVTGLPAVPSLSPTQTLNVIKLSVSDKAGNPAVPVTMQVTANLNPIRSPSLVSPPDGEALTTTMVQLQWGLDSVVPMGAIASFTVEVARTSDFLTDLQSQTINAPGTSATFTASPGRSYWRVRALDKFGQQSLYSAVRTFNVDTTPPVMSPLESAVSGSGIFQAVSGPITYAPADVRVKVQDADSGLHAASRQAAWSGDGQSFTTLLTSVISGTDGSQAEETLTVSGLNLLHSLSASDPRNHLRFRISNKNGMETENTFPVFLNRNTSTPPIAVAPSLPGASLAGETVNFEWTLDTQVPLAAIQVFELQISPDSNFVEDVIERIVNAPTVVHIEALASGSYYWRVRAIDKITPAIPSPYSQPRFFTFKYVRPPSVRIDAPMNGATENDPRSKLQATYDRGSADLDLTSLLLRLDGNELTPIVDVDYAPAGDNGTVTFEARPGPLASKHQMVASKGHLFVIAGRQTDALYSSRVFRSAVQLGGTLGAWQQTTFGLPVGLRRAGAASNKGFLYVVGGLHPTASGGTTHPETRASVYFAQPDSTGNIDSPWTPGPDLLVPAQGIAVAVANRDEDFLYAIGGEGVSDGYSDPMSFVQFARIRADGSLDAWKLTTPLPIQLSGASAFEWHGRIYVTGGQTRIAAPTNNYTFVPSQKTFFAAVDRSGNLGPWTESPETLPTVDTSNALQDSPKNTARLSAPILHMHGQLLFFNGQAINWTSIAADGTLLPWRTSAAPFPLTLQFAAAAVSGDYAYVQGGWNGFFDVQTVWRTSFNAGAAQRAVATFNPASNLTVAAHNLNASIDDIDGVDGNAAGTFNTANVSPNRVSGDSLSEFISYEPMTMTARDPATLPTPVGIALQAGLLIPPGLKIYEMAPHTVFDSPATITLGWSDADGDGIVDGTTIPENSLQMFKFNGQAWVPVTIVERDNGNNIIKGELYSASHFALMALERAPPVIATLTPVHGSTLPAGTATTIAASYSDNTGVLASGVRLYLDEADVTSQTQIGPDNTATFATATPLEDGVHSVAVSVTDVVGNFSHRGSTFAVDGTRPETALALSAGRQWPVPGGDAIYVSSDALIALQAADPLVNGASAGVDFIRYQDNAGAFQTYSIPFALTEGAHVLGYQSQDRVGNIEVLRSTNILVDAIPPQTAVHIGTPSFTDAGGIAYVTSATLVGFSAQDPALPGGQVGSELDRIEVAIDGGPYTVFSSSLAFGPGSHTVLYRAVDRVGNTEAAKVLTLRSESEPPASSFQVGSSSFVDTDGTRYVTAAAPVTFSALDPLIGGASGSGVARIEVAIDGGAFVTYSAALNFIEGRHTVLFRSVDRLGNVEATQTLALRSDASTPQSSLALQGGRQVSGPDSTTFYASTATRFAFPALDPLVSDVASGLAFTYWQDNGGAFQTYAAPIALSAGAHQLNYQSQDRVANLEVLHSTTVRVDGGPPFTVSQYGQPNAIISGVRYVTPATPLGFPSIDLVLPDSTEGSGVDRVMVEIDGAPFVAFTSSLTFAEGRHTVRFRGFDRVENAEAIKTVSPWSDATAPKTTLTFQGGLQASGTVAGTIYASTATRLALSAADPLVANVASGLAFIRWQDNGGAFQNYATPIALSEGAHVFGYQSQDRITNLEVLRSSTVLVDATAPVSTVTVGSPEFVDAGGTRFVTPATSISFSALDPALPGGAAGSGVERIEVSVDGSAFSTYSSPLTFAPGHHAVSYRSKDRVGNAEATQTLTLRSDGVVPVTALAIQGGKQASAPDAASFFASSDTRLALSATDPDVSGVASGVDFTRWQDNGGAFQSYAAPLGFSEGTHLISYQSQDRVGNAEILRSTSILVDATAPTASLSFGLPRVDRDGTRYVSTSTLLTIGAEDLSSAGSASGVGVIETSLDGAAFTAYAEPFSLAGGLRLISARAIDRVGNVSPVLSTSVVVDAAAPVFTALAPGAGARFLPSGARLEIVVQAADGHDTAPTISAALVQLEDRGSPRGNRPGVVPVQDGSSFAALDLDDGLWELRAAAVDFVSNGASAVSGPFEVIHDLMAPRTNLSAGTPLALVAGASVVARGTTLTLASIDDLVGLGDVLGLGVASQQVSVDGVIRTTFTPSMPGPGIVFTSTFSLSSEPDGWHQVGYFATDVLGNVENGKVSTYGIDDTAPETSLAILGGRQAAGPDSQTFYASSGTTFALPAVDRVVNGVASGVDFTRWQDNGGTFMPYTAPFVLQEGPHLLAYQTQDRLGKLEVLRSTTVRVDAAAPQTSSAFGLPTLVGADGTRFVTPATPLSFTAADPALPGGTAGSGVERIESSVDGAAFSTYTTPLTFAEGRHTVQFRAVDRVGNVEPPQTISLRSDASAPQTTLIAQGGRQAPVGTGFYASSDTRFALAAIDPLVADVAAGVDFTHWQDNGGGLQAYSAPFSLPEGSHLLGFQSQDRVANLETLRSSTVFVDATAPISLYSIGDPLYTGVGAVKYITPATPVTFSAQDAALPGGIPGSGTDRIEVAIDGGAFVTYGAALNFAEGRHTVLFRAVDRVGNVEVTQTLALRSDATAPETSLAVQGGKQVAGTVAATFYASSDTLFALPAADPVVADVASGVDFTTYRDNGGAIQPYSGPFTLSAGSHLLSYQSRDLVRNQETSRSTTVFVDATAPLTAFSIGTPSLLASDGTRYVTPATPVTFTSADPALPGGTAGSGIERIEVSVDGGAYTAYTSALTFAEGRHTVQFRAADRVGNLEMAQTLSMRSDASAPLSSLSLQGGRQAPGPDSASFYASSDTRFALPATDPLVADVAAGVDFTRWQDNGGAFQTYSASLALAEGTHRLDFQSQDRVANLETLRSTTVYVDATAPVSSYSIGDPLYTAVGAVKYITPATPVTFSAVDAALPGGAPGAGTDRIEVAIDGGAFVTYGAALTFAEGRHTVIFRAVDKVGNIEAAHTLALRSDATAPETSLAVQGGKQVAGPSPATFYASSDTRFALPAADPLVADVASGVDFTTYRDNGGAIQPYYAPFALTAGSHLLTYQSRDVVRNQEVSRSTTVLVDSGAPVSSYSIGEPLYNAPGGIKFVTPATPVAFSAADPSLPGGTSGSGVDRIEVAVDGGAFTAYSSALTFAEGRHTVEFRAVDRVGNVEPAQSLALRSDASKPETSLAVLGGKQTSGDASTFYASSDTRFSLAAADPVVADVASGVDFTTYRDNAGAFQPYSAPFSLPEGSHALSYQSRDRVTNLETIRSTTVLVDATAPLSSFAIGAPAFIDQDGTRYITPATPITFAAQDSALLGGASGSGVERVEVAVDGGAFATYTTALTFAEGRHTVQFRAVDRVGNVEAAQSLALRSDASAPLTSLVPQGGRQAAGPDNATFYASSDTRFALPSLDPVSADVASGLELTRWQDSGGPFQTYSAPFALAEGSHLLAYQSPDRVANLEVLKSTTVLIDATAPLSAFTIGTPAYVDAGGTRYVTPATTVGLSAADPALSGGAAGSGVERIEVAVDGGAYGPYSAALTFAEGRHTVQFRAIDRVGNIEAAQTLALRSDNSAPLATLTVQGGTQAPGPGAFSLYASSATQVVLTATDPLAADVASGVDFIRWQDNGGPLSTYSSPLTLAEGAHLVAYQSRDRVENLEVLRSTTILLDATAPQSTFVIGSPSFTGSDGTRFISPAAPVSFTAQDPNLPGGTAGSGVARIEVAVDGGAFAAYSSALTFPEGRHTVQYRAIDRVGNTEATRSLALRSDNSAPQTSLAVLGGRQVGGPTAESFYASSDTRFIFPATDPTVAEVTSGVDFTRWQDSGGAFQAYSSPIALAEGSHLLAYESQDHVANIEALKSTTVFVDASAPDSAFAIGAPSFVDGDGTRYITPATPVSFSASDPGLPGGTAGSGVDRIEVAVDGAAFTLYSGALNLAEGRHTVLFRAMDRVGNVEATHSLALRSDASAPQTSMAAVGGRQAPGPDAATFYASGDSRFVFPASDPVAADVASGVDFTRWRDGSGAFQTYSAPVALAEGAHQLDYQSQDKVLNLEVLLSTTVLVDASAPQSAFAIGMPFFVAADGTRYVTPATPVTVSASDPALPGGTTGSGVDRIEVAVDGAAFTLYSAALTFSEGRHTVQFRAVDRVGNSEAPQTLALRSDATPPQTAFSPSAAYYSAGGHDFAPAQFTYTLPASDPLTADVASGVAETTFGIDATPRHAYTAAFSLTEGIRTVSFGSRDNVSNLEVERNATVYVDATAPQTSLAISGGRQAPGPDAASFYSSLDTRYNLPALDPTVAGVASGLDSTRWQDSGGAFETYGTPIALAAGSHVLSYRSQDHVGNVEVLHSTTILVDAAAPVTAFQIGSPAFMAADGTRYVTPATPVAFTAADPALAAGTGGSGVERIEVSVDGAPFTTYTSALTFAEGRHAVQYRAVDRVGNVEAAQTLALRSDASAPLTSLAAQGGRQVTGPDANSFYASLDTRFALPSADPIVSDVAAGVDVTRWRDNGGALEVYSSPLALAEGAHLLAYQSQDKVQNLEILRSTTVLVDATAPLTAFSIGAPSYTDAAGVHYLTPATPVTFTAADPALPGGTAGSGADRIEVALDGADFQTYTAALTFGEGRHSIRFRAYDKVGNLEAEKTLEVRSDASAPLSSLTVQGGRQTAGQDASSQYVSADTRIVLTASDPQVADVASGVELIRWQDNGGAFQTYTVPLALAEGSHALAYQGQDKVQNVETMRSTTVLVDATAPHTVFQIGTPAFIDPSGTRYITPTTPVTFTAEDPTLPGGAAGAGVERIEVAVDAGAFVAYTTALTFPEGRHLVQFRASDRVGNVGAVQSLALRSDDSAPLTSLDIQGGRQAAGPSAATFYASTATRYALPAADPMVADVASGVEFTRWQDNGGSIMSYTGPIAFPEGVHLLAYASEDNVRNLEAQKTITALVDATPPITQFSLNGPRYAHAAGDQSVGGELFVSPTTGIELAALDPISNGVASGLERLLASADGAPFLPWAGAISFGQEGPHTLAYRGVDRVGNEEGTGSVTVSVDAAPPVTLLSFDGPALVRGPGTTWEPQQAEAFITPATKLILTTNDPVSGGVASGVKLTRYRIDNGPWQVYSGFFYLSNQGLHLVEFAAEDRVSNVEVLVAKRIAVDSTSPLVSATINGPWLEAFGLNLLSTAATVSLASNDPPAAGVAVGLARILYRIDDGGLLEYTAPFAIEPGSHTVRYQGVDLLGNTGSQQALSVRVLRFLGGSLAATGSIDGSGTADVSGLLQTDGGLSLTGNFVATGGAEASSISLKGEATLTGPVTQGVRPLASDWIDLAAIQTALDAANDNAAMPAGAVLGGVLRLNSGQTVTLATGTYLLSGIDISGGAKLLTAGPVRIFVTGSVKLGGNSSLNEAGPARNLVIFASGPAADLNSSGAAAIIYMPSAALSLAGEMRLGGSALAASIKLSGKSNATAPGLNTAAPAATSGGSGQGGKLASASFDGGVGVAAGADASFVLHEVYAFPNPAVGGARPTLHVTVGVADRVTIRIYDISGQQVHQATLDSAPSIIDDGSGPKFAYEMPWDGHIPSGVYLYTVVAEKSGQGAIRKSGKFAVVR